MEQLPQGGAYRQNHNQGRCLSKVWKDPKLKFQLGIIENYLVHERPHLDIKFHRHMGSEEIFV